MRATGELAAERGYAELTVEQIVKRAHVSYKTFYKHFHGKEEAFIALFETTLDVAERKIRQRLEQQAGSWPEQVVLALRTFIDLICADSKTARAVIVETPTVGPAMAKRYEEATEAFVPLLRAGRDLNPRGADLPATIEETLSGSVLWAAYERLVIGEVEELRASLPVLVELILRTYIGPEEAGRIAREVDWDSPSESSQLIAPALV